MNREIYCAAYSDSVSCEGGLSEGRSANSHNRRRPDAGRVRHRLEPASSCDLGWDRIARQTGGSDPQAEASHFRRYPRIKAPHQPKLDPYGEEPATDYVWGLNDAPIRQPVAIESFTQRAWALLRLIGPLAGFGGCMEPIFPDGTHFWFDSRLEPKHLDFVLVEPSQATLGWLVETSRDFPELALANPVLDDIWIKQLQVVRGRPYLVANDGQLPLADNKILGVLRHAVGK